MGFVLIRTENLQVWDIQSLENLENWLSKAFRPKTFSRNGARDIKMTQAQLFRETPSSCGHVKMSVFYTQFN